MKRFLPFLSALSLVAGIPDAARAASPEEKLPPPADRPVDFQKDIEPLFEAACIKCHAKGKDKGGFSLETRERFLKGGETDAGAVVGKSGDSLIVQMVAGIDPDSIMPKKGTKWTAAQIGLLRAWIDQGAYWPSGITFAKPPAGNLQPREVPLPPQPGVNPIDTLLTKYTEAKGIPYPASVDDRTFARRVYLDLIGLIPAPEQLETFLANPSPEKRGELVKALLADREDYADQWLTFWNDLLRNDYRGAGFIDGGRKQISGWLRRALVENMPYDEFVSELINPTAASEGFTRGIIWRGNVNASMLPPMQAAQNVSQVFLGINLKCASCHDSFVSDWSLDDAYGLAAIYSDQALELVHCDKPTGKKAAMRFLFPEVGALDAGAPKPERLRRLAEIITSPKDGRLSRTIVNRLWSRLLGRGLVEPIDDMDKPAWDRDLLDWLAQDLVSHHYDLKRTLELICASRAYQACSVESPNEKEAYVFRGPLTRRLTAEEFCDALSSIGGDWNRLPSSLEFDFGDAGMRGGLQMPKWIWTDEPVALGPQRGSMRAALGKMDASLKSLAEARKKAAQAAEQGGPLIEESNKAITDAAASLAAAQAEIAAAAKPAPAPGEQQALADTDRHLVVFRKTFTLQAAPAEAYAAILASQSFHVQVNGAEAKPIQRDGFRNNRIALLDLRPLLKVGENVIAIDVSSHTEKQMNDIERKKYPASTMHLNEQSGLAFYVRCASPGDKTSLQITTDETWRVRRNPAGAWNAAAFSDAEWKMAQPLAEGVAPVDEGPGLEPLTRKDFANIPVVLGTQLSCAVSTAARAGAIRASLLAADPLQVALDRPNREVVIPVRTTAATTIQALELSNGATLNARLQRTAAKFAPEAARDPAGWLCRIYFHALGRLPTPQEQAVCLEMLGNPDKPDAVADVLWAIVNLPEFQLIN
jgi:Protein of unknown function (DUF1549)/Protein of unknown function (DUF1553)/Planctomycete cytochrome C